MFKLALSAGHGIGTAGKRCLKSLDPKETREWWLNDRICDMVEDMLKEYTGYQLLRLDDSDDGVDDAALKQRTDAANAWAADFYLSVHHNAGANGTKAGGIVAITHPNSGSLAVEWRNELYDKLVDYTGLKGNRATPKTTMNLFVLRETKMAAVLLELGFMDSSTDVPVILSDAYAKRCAQAIVDVIVKRACLKKKASTIYRVQVGAYTSRDNAERMRDQLIAKGFPAFVTST